MRLTHRNFNKHCEGCGYPLPYDLSFKMKLPRTPSIRSRLTFLVLAYIIPASILAVMLVSYDYQLTRAGLAKNAEVREKIKVALSGQSVHFEVIRDDPDRTVHFMTDFIPDMQPNGEVHGFYSLVMDISERKEAELRQAASEQRADAASRAKSAFVANISHEIRTPMNAVLGIAQLLGNTPLRDDQRDYLDIIQASGLSLIAILNDVLDFSKIEAEKLVLERERFDIESLVEAAAALLKANCGDRKVDVAIGVSAEVQRYIMGDSYRIQQIIANLISNAVKFTSSGYVTLEFDVIERNDRAMLRFVVAESGIGISEEQNERMFQSFSQADTSTTRKFGGTGLGLVITKRLVEMMEGEIQLFSIPDIGSKFTVVLPLEIAADSPPRIPEPHHFVLLIDAKSSTRDMFVSSATFCGIRALAFESEAVAANSAHARFTYERFPGAPARSCKDAGLACRGQHNQSSSGYGDDWPRGQLHRHCQQRR